jgi:nicotinamidase-related amidase
LREEVAPLDGETVIRKATQGAFDGSEIQNVLDRKGIRNLVFAGVMTSCCVETTARDAADRGSACVLVSDACADCDPVMHDAALSNFGLYFGDVMRTADDLVRTLTANGLASRYGINLKAVAKRRKGSSGFPIVQ